jgi:hypothetical protein
MLFAYCSKHIDELHNIFLTTYTFCAARQLSPKPSPNFLAMAQGRRAEWHMPTAGQPFTSSAITNETRTLALTTGADRNLAVSLATDHLASVTRMGNLPGNAFCTAVRNGEHVKNVWDASSLDQLGLKITAKPA